MKRINLLFIFLFVAALIIKAQNPFEELGVKCEMLTLSKGKYCEFFPNDTIVRIGSVIFNTITNQVVDLVVIDSTNENDLRIQPYISSRWLSPDPLAEKYYEWSPYNFVTNNPIIKMDPDGRDGVVVIDKENKTLTVRANYYVQSESNKGFSSMSYSEKQIANMRTSINETLNNKGYSVSEGDYSGYSVQFDLTFTAGGNTIDLRNRPKDTFEDVPISNSLNRGSDAIYPRFKEKDNGDGTTSAVGGSTVSHNQVIMNTAKDSKRNRIHEIFHTLFFDHDGAEKGIGSYKTNDLPNQSDINTLINNNALQKVEKPKEDEKK